MPCGFARYFRYSLALKRLISQRIDAQHGAGGIQNTGDDLFAEQRRTGADAEIDGAILGQAHLDAAVLRHAALGDVEARHDFEARDDLDRQLHRRQGDFLQNAVHSRADAKRFLVGLEVDIRGALLDGVQQDLVDEADDRSVFDVVAAERLRIGVVVAAGDLEILEIDIVVGQARHDRFGLIDGLVDRRLQLVVLDHDELDAHRGLEADLVQGVQIGGIRDGQEQPLAALHQRQYPVLLQKLVAHRANRVRVCSDRIQIQQGHAKLVRGGNGDVAGRGQVRGDQMGHQIDALLLRLGDGVLHGLLVQQAILHQALRKAAQRHVDWCHPLPLLRYHSWT